MARILLPFLLLSSSASALNRCYYPNTKEATGDFPCDPDAETSLCCGGGSMCLSNKSCKGSRQNMIRGTCTDRTWGSLDCPLYCYLTAGIGPDLISCSNVTRSDTSFCCDHTADCCDTTVGRFELLPPNPEAWATWDNTKSQFVVVKPLSPATTTSSRSTTASSTLATTSTTAVTSTATTSSAPPAETAPMSTPTQSPSSGLSTDQGQQSSGLSTGAQVGIGVGVSVGAILLGIIAYLLWKLQRHKNHQGRGAGPSQKPGPWGEDHQYPTTLYPGQFPQPGYSEPQELGGMAKPREPIELPVTVTYGKGSLGQ